MENRNSKECHTEVGCPSCSFTLKSKHASDSSPLQEALRSPRFFLAVVGVAGFVAAFLVGDPLRFWLFLLAYLLIGGEILLQALKNLLRGKVFDENFLMGIATIGALAIGEYPEAVAVMLFYRVGEFFQELAVERSRRSISSLMGMRPDVARLRRGEELVEVDPEAVEIGSHIVVRAGERVPLDGVVVQGNSSLDLSTLTGESLPLEVREGEEVLSGAINQSGVLEIRTTKLFGESTLAKILELVQKAGSKKAKTEQFITKFARYYTPAVVIAAILLAVIPPLLIEGASAEEWFRRALVFLVVSCPCALVVSIPLSFFAGIGAASREGILIKGGNFLEALCEVDRVVFDKTGTLTQGAFEVAEVRASAGVQVPEVLRLAASLEAHSNHPIARSITHAFSGERLAVSEYQEYSGYGVSAVVEGKRVLVGNVKLMNERGVRIEMELPAETLALVAREGELIGYVVLRDELKRESKFAVARLKELGVKHIALLSGDKPESVARVAQAVGIEEYHAGLLPHEKVERFEAMLGGEARRGHSAFVGDGVNDAPALALSDVGIAMGGVGSDAAIEAADVVIMDDEITKVATAIEIAKGTRAIVWQNIVLALGVKGVILLLGALGLANLWGAVFGDVGVALLAVLNAMRVLRIKGR